ncbi:Acetyltransferase (GNAT) family protein [Salipiger thiooxidans]|uniref:Acetyltransferase (GNAT) family protein n=1 Tax=Salipiger thiooxidans TaxID=282683 RepID=A0A1G7AB43_9RHOB|nr:GNAT family N-acetyltransferase [Salipiger thiooxidans]SDE11893.1 Acetyltransferase (GNAT) family protein [Salipiger thiooxidans]
MIDSFLDTDLPHVASLLRGLNALHVQQVPHRFHDDADPETLEAFVATLMEQGGRILVYRAEGVPRGYLLWKLRDIPASAVERGRRVAVLEHIAVAPSWRRRGIARRLVERFETGIRSEGCEGWVTTVHSFNGASAALMRRAGARPAVELLEKQLV